MTTYFKNSNWEIFISIFYLFFFLICINIGIMIYFNYSLSRNRKITLTLLIYFVKASFTLFSTVLFVPILDYILTIMYCESKNGIYTHIYFSNVICWKTFHILHSFFSIFITIVFISLTFIISLTFFESKASINNANAR